MSDVTAVVLSIGEPFTDRAVASIGRQTLAAAETIVVRDVSPFHRALNQGAAQVRTQFFAQVDADMILEPTCLEELRTRMDDRLGLVSAYLRDALMGRAQGIRLYRTACFEHVEIRDTISPDMDFAQDIQRHGWGRLYALRYGAARPEHWHTCGDHQPDYTPNYTFCKFVLEGVRSRYRRREGRVRTKFRQLRASRHHAATIALIALSHGLFQRGAHDLLVPYGRTADFELLETFLAASGDAPTAPGVPQDGADGDLRRRFASAYEWGYRCRLAGAPSAFLARLRQLTRQDTLAAWLALVGMCHGLFHQNGNGAEADESYASLAEILAEGPPW